MEAIIRCCTHALIQDSGDVNVGRLVVPCMSALKSKADLTFGPAVYLFNQTRLPQVCCTFLDVRRSLDSEKPRSNHNRHNGERAERLFAIGFIKLKCKVPWLAYPTCFNRK
jgi:hypothetical protein